MFAASKTASVSTAYQISRSLRFNSADTAYLNRTPASAGNRRKWTFSAWVKRSGTGDQKIFSGGTGTGSTDYIQLFFGGTTDSLRVSTYVADLINTTSVDRDYSAWYHIVWNIDTDNATATNRMQLYVNNTLITTANVTGDLGVNQTQQHSIGSNNYGAYFNGYMTEINFIDGQALTPSSFGATSTTTGVWSPIQYTGTYGTNGFYLNFSDNSNTTAATLGKDYSGNGNNWTPNNFSVTAGAGNDSMVDVPTPYGVDTGAGGTVRGNYATFNPLQGTGITGAFYTANGNLDLNVLDNSGYRNVSSTFSPEGFKGYCEITIATAPNFQMGFSFETLLPTNTLYTSTGTFYIVDSGVVKDGPNVIKSGCTPAFLSGDIFQIAFDFTGGARNVWFGRNGTWGSNTVGVGDPANGTNPVLTVLNIAQAVRFYFGINTGAGTVTINANFGQRPFAYTAPSGFKALCTQNLPTPTVGATTATQAGKFFNSVLWTGDGTQTRSITGLDFQPDLTWMKIRADTPQDHQLYDAVRGAGGGKNLSSNTTAAEGTVNGFPDSDYGYLSSFDSVGFSVNDGAIATTGGYVNYSGRTYVAWNWKANGAGSTNTSGTITSTVSANTTSGFSIVTYTGNSTSGATVGHGLGATPSMVIVKGRNASGLAWCVYHSSLGPTQYLFLNDTAAAGSYSGFWNNTSPTSTLLTLGNDNGTNGTSKTYVAYCFAPIAGYSAFGSYTGNGSADGTFVYTGFRPAFIMIKRTDTGASDWQIIDTTRDVTNVAGYLLQPNASNAESNATPVLDFLSNGFKNRNSYNVTNASGGTYIYMAFASSPFKFSLARQD